MRIVIGSADASSLKRISDILIGRNDITELHVIRSYQRLKEEINKDFMFDILIVEMSDAGKDNGLKIAKQLLEKHNYCKVIFIEEKIESCVQDLFLFPNVAGFLLKPIESWRLERLINIIVQRNDESKGQILDISTKSGHYIVNVDDVEFLEGKDHNVEFHMVSRKDLIVVSKTLHYYEKLLSRNFVRCHKGFIVNMKYIISYNRHEILLCSGETISIGRAFYENMKTMISQYLKYSDSVVCEGK